MQSEGSQAFSWSVLTENRSGGPPRSGRVSEIAKQRRLKLASRTAKLLGMAETTGDAAFAQQCDQWFAAGSKAMEEHLRAGTHYRLYNEFKSGKKSDVVMGCQLDGEWTARFHGLPGVFPPDRVQATLATIAKANADPRQYPFGMRVFANADGSKLQGEFGCLGNNAGTCSAEGFMLGMTCLFHGHTAFGADLIRRTLACVMVDNGYTWDFPLSWQVDTGKRTHGSDYYQNMILWSVPAARASNCGSRPCNPSQEHHCPQPARLHVPPHSPSMPR
jgi:uncharacterized protein (DUF608 family)